MKVFSTVFAIILTGVIIWFIFDSTVTIVKKLRAKKKAKKDVKEM